ncbi:uncharacterized protein LOC110727839 [Chenopodium quinoa]|uniref:uncharacterized protein LOC110727839 n=1 Tax=Chenopodium quinoa TaxID=63459 RepID=UPI000B788EDC|nr:uncharacterized protein LOC110727839 [Chenopodium quinoa]
MISTSSSNWLDRLRSSRGFPTGKEPDLDRFLSSSSSGSAPTADSATHSDSTHSHAPPIPARSRREKPPDSAGEFAGVLCGLFNMGGEASRTFSKKSSRKQANPRFCGASSESELPSGPSSSDDLRREKSDNGGFVSSGDNSLNDNGGNINVRVDEVKFDDDVVEEVIDLKSYSRSEVTIIDTSFDEWKSDKWVFRKNDEWKIKDKKCKFKSRVSGGKKRNLLVDNLGDDNKFDDDQLNKKNKVVMKEDDKLLQPNKGQHQNDKERRPTQERENFPSKVSQRRFPCPRPPKKTRKEDSPVILLKSIPSSNTNAAITAGKCFQKKRPKQMKIT